jgi:hypothetical protein
MRETGLVEVLGIAELQPLWVFGDMKRFESIDSFFGCFGKRHWTCGAREGCLSLADDSVIE